MREVFIGVCCKVEVVGVWGRVVVFRLVCVCVSFGCVGLRLFVWGVCCCLCF